MSRISPNQVVIEVCLYGNREVGAGYIWENVHGQKGGSREPKVGRTMTEAVWLAVAEARASVAIPRGKVRVFAPGGEFVAEVPINRVGYYGNMEWRKAGGYVIDTEAIIAAGS